MKYLLFTNPDVGYFPSMTDKKSGDVNRFKVALEHFLENMDKDLPPELREQLLDVQDMLEPERQRVIGEAATNRPGVYQWHEAFNTDGDVGEVRTTFSMAPSELEDYDIIHVNGAGGDADLLSRIKEALRGSSIPVIYNLDYAIENWQSGFPRVQGFYQSIMQADFVFAVEPGQAALINYLLHYTLSTPRKKVHVPIIQHPVDVQGLRKIRETVSPDMRMDKIMVCYHRYDKHIYIPSAVTWNLEAYHPKIKGNAIKVPVYMAGVGSDITVPLDMFDGWVCYKNWPFYLYELAHATIGCEYYSIHSHSRFPEECAALGIPTVGTLNSYSIAGLHPLTAHGMLDFHGMRNSLERLMGDEEFYLRCQEYAEKKVEELDYRPRKARLLMKMDEWLMAEGKA